MNTEDTRTRLEKTHLEKTCTVAVAYVVLGEVITLIEEYQARCHTGQTTFEEEFIDRLQAANFQLTMALNDLAAQLALDQPDGQTALSPPDLAHTLQAMEVMKDYIASVLAGPPDGLSN